MDPTQKMIEAGSWVLLFTSEDGRLDSNDRAALVYEAMEMQRETGFDPFAAALRSVRAKIPPPRPTAHAPLTTRE